MYPFILGNSKTNGLITSSKYPIKYLELFIISINFEKTILQALRTLFHIEGTKFFKKGQFQDRLKQHTLEQSPG